MTERTLCHAVQLAASRPKYGFIYLITNEINGRVYVGSSFVPLNRWHRHKADLRSGIHHCQFLQRDWVKCGEDAFVFDIDQCGIPSDDLLRTEQDYIDFYKSEDDWLYNCAPNAGSCFGVKQSPETIEKRAAKLRGRKRPASVGRKISEAKRGRGNNAAAIIVSAAMRRFKPSDIDIIQWLQFKLRGGHWQSIYRKLRINHHAIVREVRLWLEKNMPWATLSDFSFHVSGAVFSETTLEWLDWKMAILLNSEYVIPEVRTILVGLPSS